MANEIDVLLESLKSLYYKELTEFNTMCDNSQHMVCTKEDLDNKFKELSNISYKIKAVRRVKRSRAE